MTQPPEPTPDLLLAFLIFWVVLMTAMWVVIRVTGWLAERWWP